MGLWRLLISASLIVTSGLGLLVLSGGARDLMAPSLEARLVVQDYPIPDGFGVDPELVAGFMAERLVQRLDDDIALRLTLKPDARKSVREIVIPRLMNVVVVEAMMKEIPELSAMLELGAIRHTVAGQVSSSQLMQDVALTLPGALFAEVDGEKLKLTTTSTGLTALTLGDFSAGQVRQVRVWLGEDSQGYDLARSMRVGAKSGARGRVLLWGTQGWFGSDLEALRWSRWLVAALLAGVLLYGLSSLMLPLLTQLQGLLRRAV